MSKTWQIFVPEWVPLENKGEEAIIRGMADVIFPEGNVEFHILDMCTRTPYSIDGLHVYPGNWFYSPWLSQEFRLGIRPNEIYASTCSLLRNGINKLAPAWIQIPQRPIRKTGRIFRKLQTGQLQPRNEKTIALKRILDCDYLIAGHDGAFNAYDCHIMNLMRSLGMRHGLFGSSLLSRFTSRSLISHYHRTLSNCDFFYVRNRRACEWAKSYFGDLNPQLAPDPAFGMFPAKPERVDDIIAAESLESFFMRPVVMMTTAEPAPIARHSFENVVGRPAKLARHHDLLAKLATHIIGHCGANILFLPHTIGPTPDLDDRQIAKKVIKRMALPPDRVRVLTTEYSARDLKGLIGRADTIVAERIHSLIGAVGMNTPFLCLGVKQDNRVNMIIGDMCKSKDLIYYLNQPDERTLCDHFDRVWSQRQAIRSELKDMATELNCQLDQVRQTIRSAIEHRETKM